MTNNLYQDLNRQMQRDYMTLSTDYALLNRSVSYAGIYFCFCLCSLFFEKGLSSAHSDLPKQHE